MADLGEGFRDPFFCGILTKDLYDNNWNLSIDGFKNLVTRPPLSKISGSTAAWLQVVLMSRALLMSNAPNILHPPFDPATNVGRMLGELLERHLTGA